MTASVTPLFPESSAGLRRQIEDALRTLITSGAYKPGERLRERALLEKFAVSRPLLREALRQIAAEGLVVTEARRGAIVTAITYDDAQEIYEVRGILEAQACRNFADQGSSSQLRALRNSYERLTAAAHDNQVREVLAAKSEFYTIIVAGCGSRLIGEMLASLNNRISLLRQMSLSDPSRMPEMLDEIAALLTAIQTHDPQAAASAALHHVRQAGRAALKLLREVGSTQDVFRTGRSRRPRGKASSTP